MPLGKGKKYTVLSTVCGAVIDIVLNLLFIPRWGAAGAAVSTLIAEIVVLLVQVYCLRNMLREMIDFRDILKVIIVSAIAAGCLIIVRLTMNFTYLLVSLIVTAIVFFGVEAVGLILLKEEIVDQYFVQKNSKWDKKKQQDVESKYSGKAEKHVEKYGISYCICVR